MERLLVVCLGGALGTGARYLLTGWVPRLLGAEFPYGTMLVNVIGSLLMGFVMSIALESTVFSPGTRIFLTSGLMGGFTTFSSFTYETLALVEERAWGEAALNLVVTVGTCMLAGALGIALAHLLVGD